MRERGGRAGGPRHQQVAAGIELILVDAVDEHHGVVGGGGVLLFALEGRTLHHHLRTCLQVTPQRAPRSFARGERVDEPAGGVHDHDHAVFSPGDQARVALEAQDVHVFAMHAQQAGRLVDHLDVALRAVAPEVAVEGAVRAVLVEVLGHGVQGLPYLAAHVHHEAVEVVPVEVIPERQLAYAAQAVDAQDSGGAHICGSFLGVMMARRPRNMRPVRPSRLSQSPALSSWPGKRGRAFGLPHAERAAVGYGGLAQPLGRDGGVRRRAAATCQDALHPNDHGDVLGHGVRAKKNDLLLGVLGQEGLYLACVHSHPAPCTHRPPRPSPRLQAGRIGRKPWCRRWGVPRGIPAPSDASEVCRGRPPRVIRR